MRQALAAALLFAAAAAVDAQVVEYQVEGDGIPKPLTGIPGNPTRGRNLLIARDPANCLECHTIAKDKAMAGGTRAPALDGIGAVLSPAQLRLSVVDYSQVVPKAGMPSFHKKEGGLFTAKQDREKPVLNAQQIEDVVAFLSSLKVR